MKPICSANQIATTWPGQSIVCQCVYVCVWRIIEAGLVDLQRADADANCSHVLTFILRRHPAINLSYTIQQAAPWPMPVNARLLLDLWLALLVNPHTYAHTYTHTNTHHNMHRQSHIQLVVLRCVLLWLLAEKQLNVRPAWYLAYSTISHACHTRSSWLRTFATHCVLFVTNKMTIKSLTVQTELCDLIHFASRGLCIVSLSLVCYNNFEFES